MAGDYQNGYRHSALLTVAPLTFSVVNLSPPSPLPCVSKYTYCIHIPYTVCKRGGDVWGSGPRTDKHLPQRPFQVNFLDADILHCLLWVLSTADGLANCSKHLTFRICSLAHFNKKYNVSNLFMLGIYELQTILNRYRFIWTHKNLVFTLKRFVARKNIQFFLYSSGSKTCVLPVFKNIGG